MKYRLLLLKRMLEDIVMFPFILLGRLIAKAKPLTKEYTVFFFFPFYHTGGAEKIHSLITRTATGGNCIVFFTRKSQNQTFLSQFRDSGCQIIDISKYTDNKALYFLNIIYRGIISGYINRQQKKPVVFNGQCNFGYKLSPWIRKDIRQLELIHSLNSFSYIRIPFLPFITATIMISLQKIREHKLLYQRFGIPEELTKRIHYIPNASDFEIIDIAEKDFSQFRVFYSGRSTPEKRPHLVAAIAEKVHEKDPTIEFVMAGDSFNSLQKPELSFIDFRGNIADTHLLHSIYRRCNVLLITSATEGFPLAVIEGMAYGCVILATPVGDIPEHVKNDVNGYVFSSVEDEETIIQEGVDLILQLKANKALLKTICVNNIAYAHANFTLQQFGDAYKKLIYS